MKLLRREALPLAIAIALALPGVAPAAYAPKLAVTIDPTAPGRGAAQTTTITQALGETASKTIKLAFPMPFSAALGVTLDTCTAAQESARTCPDGSKLGTATAASPLGTFTGNVYFGGPAPGVNVKLIVFLSNGLSLLDQTIEGGVNVTPAGIVSTFDNLPNVPTTSFTLKLDGPPRSLLVTPTTCDTYTFVGTFTSQQGETATASSPVTIAGCQAQTHPPAITAMALSPRHPRAGKRAALKFTLDAVSNVVVKTRGPGGRRVTRKLLGQVGPNRISNVAGRLKAGRYTISLTATLPSGPANTVKLKARVKR